MNKIASNKTFEKKIGKYRSSSLFYTQSVVNNYDSGELNWTNKNIDERCSEWANLAVEIWPLGQIR